MLSWSCVRGNQIDWRTTFPNNFSIYFWSVWLFHLILFFDFLHIQQISFPPLILTGSSRLFPTAFIYLLFLIFPGIYEMWRFCGRRSTRLENKVNLISFYFILFEFFIVLNYLIFLKLNSYNTFIFLWLILLLYSLTLFHN